MIYLNWQGKPCQPLQMFTRALEWLMQHHNLISVVRPSVEVDLPPWPSERQSSAAQQQHHTPLTSGCRLASSCRCYFISHFIFGGTQAWWSPLERSSNKCFLTSPYGVTVAELHCAPDATLACLILVWSSSVRYSCLTGRAKAKASWTLSIWAESPVHLHLLHLSLYLLCPSAVKPLSPSSPLC